MSALANAAALLGPDADQTLLEVSHRMSAALLLSRIRSYDPLRDETPPEMDNILTELTVARYNRIGSEGITSHTVEGHSATYSTDPLEPYAEEIERWAIRNGYETGNPPKPKVRFL